MSCITTNIGSNGGCLSARISRVGNTLNANIGLADEHIIATISRVSEGLKANIGIVDESLIATISRIGGNLKANVGIICTPNTNAYLFVEPEVIWLTPDTMSVDFVVRSNTKWIIE
jgi:hypothetical protein